MNELHFKGRRSGLGRVQAFIAALVVTGIVALCMLVVGVNAATNTNTVPVQNAPGTPAAIPTVSAAGGASQATVDQLQAQNKQLRDLIAQYQARDQQLQQQLTTETQKLNDETQQLNSANQQLNDENQQLSQASAQVQQMQDILNALQDRGLIRIGPDGTIRIRRGD